MLFTRWLWYSAIAGSLLKTVGQVHRIEVVALLIGLIYLVLVLLMWCRELDQVAFINVHIVGGAVVVWARLNTVVDNGRCRNGLICSLAIIRDILVDDGLGARFLPQRLLFFVLRDELRRQLHDRILYACSGQILNPSLRDGRRVVIETTLIGGGTSTLVVHTVGN